MYTIKKITCKHLIPLILLLIIIGGFFLRFYNLGAQPYWMDEGYTINAVLSVLEKGNTVLDSGQNYFCPLYCYPTASMAQVFGANAFSYRLLSVIMGILLIFAVCYIIKRLFDKNTALLASFFVSFSYWQIAWSRQARWYTMLILFFWLAIYCFYQFLETNNRKQRIAYLISSISLSALAVLTHKIAYLLAPIFLILLLVKLTANNNSAKINKKTATITAVAIFLTVLILELFSNFSITRSAIAKFSLYYELPYYLSFFITNYWPFIFLSLYAYFGAPREQKIKRLMLILPFAVYLIAFSFFTNIVHYRYLLAPALGFLLLGAVGAIDIFNKLWFKYRVLAVLFITTLILTFFVSGQGVWRPLPFYTLENDNIALGSNNRSYHAYTPQPNWNSAYAYIKQGLNEKDIVISSHPHFNKIFLGIPGYWIKYNYLGFDNRNEYQNNNTEFYVGARIINDLAELESLTATNHGYIIFDYMSADGKIPQAILNYIQTKFILSFHEKTNTYSEVWVYKF